MMHYKPWIFHQQMLMDQNPYYQYTTSDLPQYYSLSEHQEEDYDHTGDEMPSETSGDQSPNTDMFRLAFAASQWSKLVLNAEGLFNQLISTNALPTAEQNFLKNQIEQWLCLKQEYEECITGDDSGSLQGYNENIRRSLERIEEVTETDEKTDESSNWIQLQSKRKSCSGSESEASDDEDQSDTESENPDFLERLDEYMNKFELENDEIINSKKNDFSKLKDISPEPKSVIMPTVKPVRNPSSRRVSILPHSEMSNELVEFQKQNSHINFQQKRDINQITYTETVEKSYNIEKSHNSFEDDSAKAIIKVQNTSLDPEQASILETLMIDNAEKQSKLKKIQSDLDVAYKQLDELQNAIKVKEQFIDDMIQNSDVRNKSKQKFQKKRSEIEEKYNNIEKALNYKRTHRDTKDDFTYNEEIEKYENLLSYYEKKLKNTKIIKQVVDNSAKTVVYLKNSLGASKKQMEKLKQQLKNEEEQKQLLEDELVINQKKVKELEKKYNLVFSNSKEIIPVSKDIKNCQRSQTKSQDKEQSSIEANEKIYRLGYLFKEKLDLERTDNSDEKRRLRQEIQNLRLIRDRLIEMKCKSTTERISLTDESQRQLLLISEYIETIDAMIEQKNVMICGRADLNGNKCDKIEEQTSIMNRLEKLSHNELVTLFDKYFHKVVDLKESSKNLEIQNATLEETLKKQELENDTSIIMLQKSYERQISLLLNYYAEETSSSSYDRLDRNKDFERLMKENQVLRRRLAHFNSLLKASASTQAVRTHSVKNTKPVIKSELMQIALPPKTTKVTRQGNKLIFQKSKKEK